MQSKNINRFVNKVKWINNIDNKQLILNIFFFFSIYAIK